MMQKPNSEALGNRLVAKGQVTPLMGVMKKRLLILLITQFGLELIAIYMNTSSVWEKENE